MFARFRFASLYLAVVVACYFAAWAVACIVVNGDLGYSVEYFKYFWAGGGGERPVFTGMLGVVLTIPFSLIAIWLLRRSLKKKDEKKA